MNWKKLASLGVVAMMSLSILCCGSDSASDKSGGDSASISGSVTGSGSSALLPLAKDAADKFKELHPEVSITLNGGGSGTGLKQVADGSVDIVLINPLENTVKFCDTFSCLFNLTPLTLHILFCFCKLLLIDHFTKIHDILNKPCRYIKYLLPDDCFQRFFPDKVCGTASCIALVLCTAVMVL